MTLILQHQTLTSRTLSAVLWLTLLLDLPAQAAIRRNHAVSVSIRGFPRKPSQMLHPLHIIKTQDSEVPFVGGWHIYLSPGYEAT